MAVAGRYTFYFFFGGEISALFGSDRAFAARADITAVVGDTAAEVLESAADGALAPHGVYVVRRGCGAFGAILAPDAPMFPGNYQALRAVDERHLARLDPEGRGAIRTRRGGGRLAPEDFEVDFRNAWFDEVAAREGPAVAAALAARRGSERVIPPARRAERARMRAFVVILDVLGPAGYRRVPCGIDSSREETTVSADFVAYFCRAPPGAPSVGLGLRAGGAEVALEAAVRPAGGLTAGEAYLALGRRDLRRLGARLDLGREVAHLGGAEIPLASDDETFRAGYALGREAAAAARVVLGAPA